MLSGTAPASATSILTNGSIVVRDDAAAGGQTSTTYSSADAALLSTPTTGLILSEQQGTTAGTGRIRGYTSQDGLIGAYASTFGTAAAQVQAEIRTTVTAAADGELIGSFHFSPFYVGLLAGTETGASATWGFTISGNSRLETGLVGLLGSATGVPSFEFVTDGISQSAFNLTQQDDGLFYAAQGDLGTLTIDFGAFKAGQSFMLDYAMTATAAGVEPSTATIPSGTDLSACGDPAPPVSAACYVRPIAIASGADPYAFGTQIDPSSLLGAAQDEAAGPGVSFSLRPAADPASLPEPASGTILLAGITSLGLIRRRRSNGPDQRSP